MSHAAPQGFRGLFTCLTSNGPRGAPSSITPCLSSFTRYHHTLRAPYRQPLSRSCIPYHPPSKRAASARARPASNPDRGPQSTEDTQTDFGTLDVLGGTAAPTTSVDECSDVGFLLDSGLRITDGDGVILIGGEAFVWRPWMAASQNPQETSTPPSQILRGVDLKDQGNGTGGLITGPSVFRIPPSAWGILGLVWPKPDLLIIGTGERIVPLEKATREKLQQFGTRIEVLDTRNAASQFNLLATERGTGEVAAAMLPCGFGVRQKRRKR